MPNLSVDTSRGHHSTGRDGQSSEPLPQAHLDQMADYQRDRRQDAEDWKRLAGGNTRFFAELLGRIETVRGNHSPEDDTRRQEAETPIPDRKLQSLYPTPYSDSLETAKIRSLYPTPHCDPLGLKRVLDNHLPEDDIFEAMWRATWMETGRGHHSPEDDTKSGKRQWKPFTETPIPERKLRRVYPKPYSDPLGSTTQAETAKIRSLYPKPNRLGGLKRVEVIIFRRMTYSKPCGDPIKYMETGRGNHSPEDNTKPGKRQWKPFTETPIPEKNIEAYTRSLTVTIENLNKADHSYPAKDKIDTERKNSSTNHNQNENMEETKNKNGVHRTCKVGKI
ncbi:hypothetical protein B9Z55_023122 [Caenorhabditis nigoni]|uniref:Uncharacterized protein n=1 Tax=Caenorhabditis nigoni TaxID=1611254 RepID=A0A2G5SNS8_9PELO|nr:hypothetical protein B9Z55_023122 [Caenorhabditis nigoni]